VALCLGKKKKTSIKKKSETRGGPWRAHEKAPKRDGKREPRGGNGVVTGEGPLGFKKTGAEKKENLKPFRAFSGSKGRIQGLAETEGFLTGPGRGRSWGEGTRPRGRKRAIEKPAVKRLLNGSKDASRGENTKTVRAEKSSPTAGGEGKSEKRRPKKKTSSAGESRAAAREGERKIGVEGPGKRKKGPSWWGGREDQNFGRENLHGVKKKGRGQHDPRMSKTNLFRNPWRNKRL